jgi:hypothetical protein
LQTSPITPDAQLQTAAASPSEQKVGNIAAREQASQLDGHPVYFILQ